MILYLLLDATSSITYWIIKNLGLSIYYSIYYLFSSNQLSEEEEEKKKLLELVIQQKEDIDKIKKIILEIKNSKNVSLDTKSDGESKK